MEENLSNLHFDLLDGRESEIAQICLSIVKEHGFRYVLAGGWAVYAYASEIPSVDVDLYIENEEDLGNILGHHGLRIGPGKEVETISLGSAIEVWGIQVPGLGLPEPSITVAELLQGRTTNRSITLGTKKMDVIVPKPEALCLAKLIALHNRSLAYRSNFDGEAGMMLGPELNNRLKGLTQDYWLRKAGKDMFDVALLLDSEKSVPTKTLELLQTLNLDDTNPTLVSKIPEVVQTMATDLARRVGRPSPPDRISRFRSMLGSS